MNVTLSEAVEIQVKTGSRKPVGMMMIDDDDVEITYAHI
jgi:hypothetical protein